MLNSGISCHLAPGRDGTSGRRGSVPQRLCNACAGTHGSTQAGSEAGALATLHLAYPVWKGPPAKRAVWGPDDAGPQCLAGGWSSCTHARAHSHSRSLAVWQPLGSRTYNCAQDPSASS